MIDQEKGKNIKISVIVLLIGCICLLIQMYALPYKRMFWMSISNRTMLVMWLGAAIVSFYMNGTRKMMGEIAIFFFSVVALFLSVSANTSMLSRGITMLVNFAAMPLMMVYLAYNDVEDISKKTLLITNFLLSLIFIRLSRSNLAYRYEGQYFIIHSDELTLGYSNPNQTAIYLFVCAINLIVGVFYFKNKFLKLLFGADFIYMLVLLEETKCRTSLLLIGVFLVLIFVRNIPKRLIDIALIVPLLYAFAAQFMFPYFEDMTFMGESLFNGRQNIFGRYFDDLNIPRFLFGNFLVFEFDNLHNAYVSIAATAGAVVLVFYVLMFKKHLRNNLDLGLEQRYERVAFIGFICIILYSSTEAAGFVGGSNYAFMNISLLAYFSKPFAKKGFSIGSEK